MIIWECLSPAACLYDDGATVSIEYTTGDESDYLEIDDQIIAMFLGYL